MAPYARSPFHPSSFILAPEEPRYRSSTTTLTSSPFARTSGMYIACPSSGSAWNVPGTSARSM